MEPHLILNGSGSSCYSQDQDPALQNCGVTLDLYRYFNQNTNFDNFHAFFNFSAADPGGN